MLYPCKSASREPFMAASSFHLLKFSVQIGVPTMFIDETEEFVTDHRAKTGHDVVINYF